MQIKHFFHAPPRLFSLAVLVFLGVLLYREASTLENLPVFLPDEQDFIYIELEGDGLMSGVYQFNDGLSVCDVINLTDPLLAETLIIDPAMSPPLRNGESLHFVRKDRKTSLLDRGWMKASHRLSLAIPLHPDRMSTDDWTVLPGIGETLAKRIENNRQINGDFGRLDALKRVKGIGSKRLDSWRKFFGGV